MNAPFGTKAYILEKAALPSNQGVYGLIQPDILESLGEYVENGREPGGFLRSVLENDLLNATGRADGFNIHAIRQLCVFVYNEIPAPSWGNRHNVIEWLCGKRPADMRSAIERLKHPEAIDRDILEHEIRGLWVNAKVIADAHPEVYAEITKILELVEKMP